MLTAVSTIINKQVTCSVHEYQTNKQGVFLKTLIMREVLLLD